MNLPVVPLADIDLSDPEFWTKPRDWRFGAFKTLREESPFHFFEERMVENSPIPPGPGGMGEFSTIRSLKNWKGDSSRRVLNAP